jgi:L-ribulokinase
MSTYSIGLDFGTESVRALLVDVASGQAVATAVEPYADAVIDETLPGTGEQLPPDWALQNPADWLIGMERTIVSVLSQSRTDPTAVVGIGIDFTSCTVLPTTADATPLCEIASFRAEPHAWPKLWKHHGAQSQAERITSVAATRGERWLPRYGGRISSEWLLPKALEIAEEAPRVYGAAARFIEASDWVVWRLTGVLARNACAAGYKGTWHKQEGPPGRDYLGAVKEGFQDFYDTRAAVPVVSPGTNVGTLTEEWSARLGLPRGVAVAA